MSVIFSSATQSVVFTIILETVVVWKLEMLW